jgi:hypothetical protein
MTLTAQAPTTDAESTNLFPEAKRRRRRRRIVLAAIITPLGVAVGVSLAQGGTPPKEPPFVSRPGDDGSSLPAAGHWVAQGNGIGQARFGQPESVAIANLERVLGAPLDRAPLPSPDCTVDAYLQWSTLTAYFDHKRFVGYGTGSLLGGVGHRDIPRATTSAGLRIGEALSQAKTDYGSALTTSYAQGGAWFAATPSGRLAGLLTQEVDQPGALIADITAGSVGCPAASP